MVPSTGRQDRPVGDLRAAPQALGQVQTVGATAAVRAVGHAADDLGEDDAAVAARALQRTPAERLGDAVEVAPLGRQALGLGEGGPHRGQHVGARVTVRHGKDVEGVDLLDVGLEVGDGGARPRG